MQIFDPRNLPGDKKALQSYGDDEIRELAKFFAQASDGGAGIVDEDAAIQEWPLLRSLMNGSYSHLDLSGFAKQVLKLHKATFPASSLLLSIAIVLPVTNAGSERGFSTQNRITTKLRNRLLEGSIDRLMRIAIECPPVKSFDFGRALAVWREAKGRRIFGQQSRPK